MQKTENNRGTNGVSGDVDYGAIMVQHVSLPLGESMFALLRLTSIHHTSEGKLCRRIRSY